MSFVKLNKNNFATTSVNLSVNRSFVSSSLGVTGALHVIVDRSHTQKDNIDDRVGLTGENEPQPFGENTFEGRRRFIMEALASPDIEAALLANPEDYIDTNIGEMELAQLLDGSGINAGAVPPEYEKYGIDPRTDAFTETGYSDLSMHPRNSTQLLIRTLKPTSSLFSSGSMALNMAERILVPYYKTQNAMMGSKYVNFNCMNFFNTVKAQALVYIGDTTPAGTDAYDITGDFSIEFWIKINPSTGRQTVIHSPGRYSVSVVPSAEVDHRGYPTSYALGLAYSGNTTNGSNDKPDNLNYGTTAHTFLSNQFLQHDIWTHCAITVGHAEGDITFFKDGEVVSNQKNLSSAPIYVNSTSAIVLGAYWSGGQASISNFNGTRNVKDQGLGDTVQVNGAPADSTSNSLNANIHEIRVFTKKLNKKQIKEYKNKTYTGSLSDHSDRNLIFYVPCLYDVDYRVFDTHMITPVQTDFTFEQKRIEDLPAGFQQDYLHYETVNSKIGTTVLTGSIPGEFTSLDEIFSNAPTVNRRYIAAPYNTNHADLGNFANMNIQAFSKDFANLNFPYCHHLSESLGTTKSFNMIKQDLHNPNALFPTVHALTSSFTSVLGHQARNCFILPCDNGDFRPDYNTLNHATGSNFLERDGFLINTKAIGDRTDILGSRLFFVDDVFASRGAFTATSISTHTTQGGDTRYNAGVELFKVIDSDMTDTNIPNLQLPSTDTSDFGEFFDANDFAGPLTTIITIPQLYYGNRIKPGSIKIRSTLYNGDRSQIELRDNGEGILYRHQTSGSVANWNKVGDVFYGEGLIYVRNPSLYAMADNDLDIEFKSENKTNVLETNVFCKAGLVNSSSNPNFQKLRPTSDENEQAEEFVYISTVYLHDDNMNVVAKAKLSQPVIKRSENKFLFRLKVDF